MNVKYEKNALSEGYYSRSINTYTRRALYFNYGTFYESMHDFLSMIFQSKTLAQTPHTLPVHRSLETFLLTWPTFHNLRVCDPVLGTAGVSQRPSLQVARVRVSPEAVLGSACFKALL